MREYRHSANYLFIAFSTATATEHLPSPAKAGEEIFSYLLIAFSTTTAARARHTTDNAIIIIVVISIHAPTGGATGRRRKNENSN